jgi:hypothetical protein
METTAVRELSAASQIEALRRLRAAWASNVPRDRAQAPRNKWSRKPVDWHPGDALKLGDDGLPDIFPEMSNLLRLPWQSRVCYWDSQQASVHLGVGVVRPRSRGRQTVQ